jgi:type III secretory pathway component EscT
VDAHSIPIASEAIAVIRLVFLRLMSFMVVLPLLAFESCIGAGLFRG